MAKKTLSIFIDESGDFGNYEKHSPYYIVTMVLHNQSVNISDKISDFYCHIENLGYKKHAIHAGPLIRRESVYKELKMEQRKKVFNSLFNFVRKMEVYYDFVVVKKEGCSDVIALTQKISSALSLHLQDDKKYWGQFDEIIIYYDNGQIELTKILTSVFCTLFNNVVFKKVSPIDYVLFQAADLICTLELTNQKFIDGLTSKSEKEFFISRRDFQKNYMKVIQKKYYGKTK